MKIRGGTREQHEDACVAIWLAALEQRDGVAPSPESSARAYAKFERPIVRLGLHDEGFALTVSATAETASLELIAVAPGATARGIGSALLDDAIRAAETSGYLSLDLWVRRSNDRAIALYSSRDLVPTGAVEPHPLGGEPMVELRRVLEM